MRRAGRCCGGDAVAATYNPPLSHTCRPGNFMEAERLNQIAATATSLKARTAELRRYL